MNLTQIRVFIVDDHPLVRDWLKNLLQMEQDFLVVGEADDPASALSAMEANAPDVAVVDLSLKRGSGLDLIKAMRAQLPGIRTLVLSMHEEISDVDRALRAGARGYVMKGESSGQIVPAIRQVHGGKIYATPDVLAQLAERMTRKLPGDASKGVEHAAEILSDRELDVFRRLGEGHSTRRIAEDLNVSQKTIQTYCARIKEKIGLDDGTELFLTAIRWREAKRF